MRIKQIQIEWHQDQMGQVRFGFDHRVDRHINPENIILPGGKK